MGPFPSERARRAVVAADSRSIDTLLNPNDSMSFEVSPTSSPTFRTAEQWARATMENVPSAMRWYLRLGWKFGLGLRLGPLSSPSHVAGWRIASMTPNEIILEVRSVLMTAHNVIQVDDSKVRLTTFVRYENKAASLFWAIATPLHRRTILYLLNRASTDQG